MYDLEHILFSDAEAIRDVSYFDELVFGERALDQDADRVAGLLRQAHVLSYLGPRGRDGKMLCPACFTNLVRVARGATGLSSLDSSVGGLSIPSR